MPTTTRMATTPCSTHAQTFHADELTPATATTKQAVNHLSETVEETIEAITACGFCPLAQACKKRTIAQLESGDGPTGVVQAGIYWGTDSRPDFTLNGCVTARSAYRAAAASGFDAAAGPDNGNTLNISTDGPVDAALGIWDIDWVPEPRPRLNWPAIHMAVHPASADSVVTERYLRRHPHKNHEDKEVLTDADVDEVIQLLWKRDESVRYISAVLQQSWKSIEKHAMRLGLPIHRSPERAKARRLYEQKRAEKNSATCQEQPAPEKNPSGQLSLRVDDTMTLIY